MNKHLKFFEQIIKSLGKFLTIVSQSEKQTYKYEKKQNSLQQQPNSY